MGAGHFQGQGFNQQLPQMQQYGRDFAPPPPPANYQGGCNGHNGYRDDSDDLRRNFEAEKRVRRLERELEQTRRLLKEAEQKAAEAEAKAERRKHEIDRSAAALTRRNQGIAKWQPDHGSKKARNDRRKPDLSSLSSLPKALFKDDAQKRMDDIRKRHKKMTDAAKKVTAKDKGDWPDMSRLRDTPSPAEKKRGRVNMSDLDDIPPPEEKKKKKKERYTPPELDTPSPTPSQRLAESVRQMATSLLNVSPARARDDEDDSVDQQCGSCDEKQ